ncbi:MAG TPA: hypothetical protein VIH81_15670 [Roseiarcus sp.]
MVISLNEARAERLWRALVAAGNLPASVPTNPDVTLGDDWKGWCAWFGVDPDAFFDVAAIRARFEAAIDDANTEIDAISGQK